MNQDKTYSAFSGQRKLIQADLETMLRCVKAYLDEDEAHTVLIFQDETGEQVDFDFRGAEQDVLARLAQHPLFAKERTVKAGPGRPKLGVTGREVTLLPRHWEWLDRQPQGTSGALRRLVEEAMKREPDAGRQRAQREAVGRFLWAMAGNLPGFEEVSRALYAGNDSTLDELIESWPADIRDHVRKLMGGLA